MVVPIDMHWFCVSCSVTSTECNWSLSKKEMFVQYVGENFLHFWEGGSMFFFAFTLCEHQIKT